MYTELHVARPQFAGSDHDLVRRVRLALRGSVLDRETIEGVTWRKSPEGGAYATFDCMLRELPGGVYTNLPVWKIVMKYSSSWLRITPGHKTEGPLFAQVEHSTGTPSTTFVCVEGDVSRGATLQAVAKLYDGLLNGSITVDTIWAPPEPWKLAGASLFVTPYPSDGREMIEADLSERLDLLNAQARTSRGLTPTDQIERLILQHLLNFAGVHAEVIKLQAVVTRCATEQVAREAIEQLWPAMARLTAKRMVLA